VVWKGRMLVDDIVEKSWQPSRIFSEPCRCPVSDERTQASPFDASTLCPPNDIHICPQRPNEPSQMSWNLLERFIDSDHFNHDPSLTVAYLS
jgi:hypothetical protein